MAEFAYTNAYLLLNAVDLSDHVRSLTINYSNEVQDITAMGDTARNRLPALNDWSIDVEFNQDFASSKVDATVFSLVGAATFAVKVKAVNTTIGATNPEYQGNVLLESYTPLSGSVGDVSTATIRLVGNGTLTRATS